MPIPTLPPKAWMIVLPVLDLINRSALSAARSTSAPEVNNEMLFESAAVDGLSRMLFPTMSSFDFGLIVPTPRLPPITVKLALLTRTSPPQNQPEAPPTSPRIAAALSP